MPSNPEKNLIERGSRSSIGVGAGEPLGEPAPSPEILERVPDEIRRRLPDDVVDQLLAGARTEEEIVGPGGLLAQLTQRLVERALEVELTDHLGYERHLEPPGGTGNQRNGRMRKTLSTEHGPVQINTPRDRDGSFEPKLVRSASDALKGLTSGSWRSTAAGCPRGISRRTCGSSTVSASAATSSRG